MRLSDRMQARVQHHADLRACTLQWERGNRRQRERLASCIGEGAGCFWTTIVTDAEALLPAAVWQTAAQLRLGLWLQAPDPNCALPQGGIPGAGDRCGAALGTDPCHALACMTGPGMRPHRAVVLTVAICLRAGGADVQVEAAVPELFASRPAPAAVAGWGCAERILDIVADWPAERQRVALDVTVRSSHAAHNAGGNSIQRGEDDKAREYGGTGIVTPMALTPYGVLGPQGITGLCVAADASALCAPGG